MNDAQTSFPRRLAQFSVLALGLAVFAVSYAIITFKFNGSLPTEYWTRVCIFVLVSIAIYIITLIKFPYSDPVVLPIAITLNGIGLSQINRIDYALESSSAFNSQFIWTLLGMALLLAVCFVLKDHRYLRKLTFTSMAIAILLIIMPLIPGLGISTNGATVWVRLGPLGTFQPAEFAKVFLAIFFAGYLVENAERLQLAGKKILGWRLPRLQDLGPLLLVWGISLGVLVFQHDLGTSLLFFGMFVALLYIATDRPSWVAIGLTMFVAGAFLAYKIFSHVAARVEIWLNPFAEDIYNREFGGSGQVVQGLFALSNGGMFGTGLGEGYPWLTPFSNSDFIYTSLGEELGLTGLLAILLLYLLLIERCLSTALQVRDGFGKLLCAGIGFSIVLQVFVVIGGITRIIPLTGLTLPFIARGGSSLIANWLMVAIILSVSNSARKQSAIQQKGSVI